MSSAIGPKVPDYREAERRARELDKKRADDERKAREREDAERKRREQEKNR